MTMVICLYLNALMRKWTGQGDNYELYLSRSKPSSSSKIFDLIPYGIWKAGDETRKRIV